MISIYEIARHLLGTGMTLEDACNFFGLHEEDLVDEEIDELNSLIFYCDYCGTWFDFDKKANSEMYCNDNICIYCAEEDDDYKRF